MTFQRQILPSVIILIIMLFYAGCSSSGTLRDRDLKKLDPILRSIVVNGSHPGPLYDVTVREDGTFLIGVIIRTADPERLRRAGIPILTTGGGTATARLTVEQLKEAVRVRGVHAIELGTIIRQRD
jgi:hypothetical protein